MDRMMATTADESTSPCKDVGRSPPPQPTATAKRLADGKAIAAVKRRKFELKRQRRLEKERRESEWRQWVRERDHFAHIVEEEDVDRIRERVTKGDASVPSSFASSSSSCAGEKSNASSVLGRKRKKKDGRGDDGVDGGDGDVETCDSAASAGAGGEGILDDRLRCLKRWLQPYLDLKEGSGSLSSSLSAKRTRCDGRGDIEDGSRRLFVAEGTETVRLLIRQSALPRRRRCASLGVVDGENVDGDGDVEFDEVEECGMCYTPIRVLSILVKPSALFDDPVRLVSDVEKVALSLYREGEKEGEGEDAYVSRSSKREEKRNDDTEEGDSQISPTAIPAPPFHVLVGSESALSAVAGFPVSRGALACGVVPHRDEAWLRSFLSRRMRRCDCTRKCVWRAEESEGCGSRISGGIGETSTRILALDGLCDESNVGSAIRTAAAFGVSVVVASDATVDAWYRRSVRVSMGHVFRIPVVRVGDLARTVADMAGRFGIASYAAVASAAADTQKLERLEVGEVPNSWCCVVGNEGCGVSDAVVGACSKLLRIGMADGVDSLSVSVAIGILLHGLSTREKERKA